MFLEMQYQPKPLKNSDIFFKQIVKSSRNTTNISHSGAQTTDSSWYGFFRTFVGAVKEGKQTGPSYWLTGVVQKDRPTRGNPQNKRENVGESLTERYRKKEERKIASKRASKQEREGERERERALCKKRGTGEESRREKTGNSNAQCPDNAPAGAGAN